MAVRSRFGLTPFTAERLGPPTPPEKPTYMPSAGGPGGPMFGDFRMGDPVTQGPGKSIQTQHLGTVVGRRGAGISQITGGDQGAHAMGHYGKGGIQNLIGGA